MKLLRLRVLGVDLLHLLWRVQELGRHAVDVCQFAHCVLALEQLNHRRIELRNRACSGQGVEDCHAFLCALGTVQRGFIADLNLAAAIHHRLRHRRQHPGVTEDVQLALNHRPKLLRLPAAHGRGE
ncbi:hypothetical protein D9M71_787990 [compost metagenome]